MTEDHEVIKIEKDHYNYVCKKCRFFNLKKMECMGSNLCIIRHLMMEIEKLKTNLKEIPCTCIDAYKDRGLIAPDCPKCNYVDEEL